MFCVLQAQNFVMLRLAIPQTAPNKVTRHAVYTCCMVKGCNIFHTYLYRTAANEVHVAHLPTKFTLHEKLGEYFLINC